MHRLEVKIGDQRIVGSYTVEKGVVTVRNAAGKSKSTQLGNSAAEDIASALLLELGDSSHKR